MHESRSLYADATFRPLKGVAEQRVLFTTALVMLAVAVTAILTALAFEHIGGYQPCPLCLMQRTPYYIGIPLALITVVAAAWRPTQHVLLVVLFSLFALLMLYDAGLAAYHSGVEWGWWEGPATCAPSVDVNSAADMLNQLQGHAPSCTVAAGRLLGVSFANANVLVASFLALAGLFGAGRSWRRG